VIGCGAAVMCLKPLRLAAVQLVTGMRAENSGIVAGLTSGNGP